MSLYHCEHLIFGGCTICMGESKLKPIVLYHCPKCDYEAGRKKPVEKHIRDKHESHEVHA